MGKHFSIVIILFLIPFRINYSHEIQSDTLLLNNLEKLDIDTVSSYYLEQLYPNPFSPTYQFKFSIPESTTVTIRILDTTGVYIATVLSLELSKGWYKVSPNFTTLKNGKYFYELVTPSAKIGKKLVKLV